MYQFILLIHVFISICLIALVLMQQGKGATMGAAFGSGASQTVFGSRGSGSFLFRLTVSLIAIFFVTSIALNNLGVHAYKERASALPVGLLEGMGKPVADKMSPAQIPVAPAPADTVSPVLPLPSTVPAKK